MIDFLPSPTDPFALAQLPTQLLPQRWLRAAGQPCEILGSIVCVDRVEAWLECLLRFDGEHTRWLAVEVCGDSYRTTLWQRIVQAEMPESLRRDAVDTVAGTASYRSRGEFGAFPIPRAGLMTYREAHGVPATAAEQFAFRGPWLVGRGDGADIELTAVRS